MSSLAQSVVDIFKVSVCVQLVQSCAVCRGHFINIFSLMLSTTGLLKPSVHPGKELEIHILSSEGFRLCFYSQNT